MQNGQSASQVLRGTTFALEVIGSEEARRRGSQQGVVLEEAWALYLEHQTRGRAGDGFAVTPASLIGRRKRRAIDHVYYLLRLIHVGELGREVPQRWRC